MSRSVMKINVEGDGGVTLTTGDPTDYTTRTVSE